MSPIQPTQWHKCKLLTTREVAERLGFSIDTVLRWTREGKLPGYRVSGTARGRLRYCENDLEALLDERSTGRRRSEKRQHPFPTPPAGG